MEPKRRVTESVQRQLAAMLFDQTLTLVVGGLAYAAVVALCWVRTGEAWYLVWASIILVVLTARLGLERAFHRRRDFDADITIWRTCFIIGAWVMGAVWGAAALTLFTHAEPLVQMFVIAVENVIIMGAAARNASSPLAARGQTALGIVPLVAACLLSSDPYYRAFSLFLFFALFAANTLIYHLYDQHVRFLCMNEENVELVKRAQQTNLELAAANEQLEVAAMTDSLTGIANRRRFDAALADEVRRAQREQSDLALLILDIDNFKGFNDLYGHQAGDACLQRVAARLSSSMRRSGDLAARYGGEEYAAILPHTDAAAALAIAESIRRAIEALAIGSAASAAGVLSVSIGVATFSAGRFRRPEDFIRSADEALYAAKAAGRNCVRVSRDEGMPVLCPAHPEGLAVDVQPIA